MEAGDIQRIIAARIAEGLGPKSIRNLWATVNLIRQAALDQKCVDALLPKPKLPHRKRVQPRCFRLQEVGRIIAASVGEATKTGLRAAEIAGLRLTDMDGESLQVNRSVWHGEEQEPHSRKKDSRSLQRSKKKSRKPRRRNRELRTTPRILATFVQLPIHLLP